MGYLLSIFGGGGLEVFGICQLPLNLGNYFLIIITSFYMKHLNILFIMLLLRELKKHGKKEGFV